MLKSILIKCALGIIFCNVSACGTKGTLYLPIPLPNSNVSIGISTTIP